MANWQKVYENSVQHRVEIVKAILEDHDIPAIIVSKKDSAYQLNNLGSFELHVTSENTLEAIKIINEEIEFG